VNNAQSAVNTLTGLKADVQSTFNILQTSVNNNNSSSGNGIKFNNGGSNVWAPAAAIKLGFDDWVSNGVESSVTTYPSPNKIGTSGMPQMHFYYAAHGTYTEVLDYGGNTVIGTEPTASLLAITNSYSSYDSAYTAFSNAGGDTALTNAQTALSDAQNTLATAQSSLATKQSELATAKSEVVTARNNYNALFGPYLLDKEKIGLDRAGNTVTTANGENAITVTANAGGLQGQIAGLTISVTDSQGNVKKSVNAVLNAFNESIRAEEASEENAIVLQTGTKANQSIKIGLSDMRARALGLQGSDGSTLNIGTQKNANAAINVLDNAVQKALDQQTTIGSIQSRLEYTSANLTTATENVQASESTIRDANMPKEMMEFTKNNILTQATQAMLAQANQSSSDVLSLLR
jgi:flagellin